MIDPRMKALIKIVQELGERVERLADRVDVVEERSCTNYNSIDEIEDWKKKVEDIIEDY
jgi:hypothetical protein